MGKGEKLQFEHEKILYILDLGLKNFINTVKVSWENSQTFWKYQNFSFREDVQVRSPPIYGQSVKSRKTMVLVGIIQVETFQGGVWWVEIFRVRFFLREGIFLERFQTFLNLFLVKNDWHLLYLLYQLSNYHLEKGSDMDLFCPVVF